MIWARMLAYITGTVDQELLLRNEYLAGENRILRAQVKGRLLLSDSEKITLAEIAHRVGRKALADVVSAVNPDILLRWYGQLIASKFDGSRFRKSIGRPLLEQEIELLVVRMARENPSWGYDRIVGAMANLGHKVSDQTVANICKRHDIPPAPKRKQSTSWKDFIRAHKEVMVGTDFFTAEVLTLKGLRIMCCSSFTSRAEGLLGRRHSPSGSIVDGADRHVPRYLTLLSLLLFVLTGSLPAQNWGAPVWSDEFNGAANSAPDSTKWTYDVGNLNVNHELEIYCANPVGASPAPPCDGNNPNAYQDGNGNLVLKAIKTTSGTWTSARLKTQGISAANFQYGRIEARMRLPSATGLWPAFWMLGSNISTVGWPQSGEIDIMENVLTAPLGATSIKSTIHGPGYSGGNGIGQGYTFPNGGRVDDSSYHIYGAIWSPYLIQFYVDDPTNIFFTIPANRIPSGTQWVYNSNFFLIMNLAVGGDWPGPPDGTTPNPSLMYVDYVRVYKAVTVPGPGMTASPITVTAGQTGTSTLNLNSAQGRGKVYLVCSNAPANSTCSITPPYLDFSSSATATASLSLTTQPHTSALFFEKKHGWVLLTFGGLMIGLLPTPAMRRRKSTHLIVTIALLGLFGMGMDCGGGGSPRSPTPTQGGTPSGTYSLTVTSYTVSADQSTLSIPVTVN